MDCLPFRQRPSPGGGQFAPSQAPRRLIACVLAVSLVAAIGRSASAQPPGGHTGEVVPRDVREMYERGLKYLAQTQREEGSWTNTGMGGPGTVGMALMVFLASGEDPNFGLYSVNVRRALRNIIAPRMR